MRPFRHTLDRAVPALLMALGVTLVVSGLLSFATPAVGVQPTDAPGASPTFDPGPPNFSPGPTDPGNSPDPTAVSETLPPSTSPSDSPSPSASASPTAQPTPTPIPTLPNGDLVVASRVRVPSLKIDLPILSGAFDLPGNQGHYPLCDVAMFQTNPPGTSLFHQPYDQGTTYLFSHARVGMFLPLLDASLIQNGKQMLGAIVQVYTSDGRLWLYEIFQVKRHATDYSLATDVPAGEHRLILQTSEGGHGHIPKLQVAARLLNVQQATLAAANPTPHPRICF